MIHHQKSSESGLSNLLGNISDSKCPVKVKFKINLCFEINGAAAGSKQVMVFKQKYPETMAATISHELGHSMGMTIMPKRNPVPPGLSAPLHVDQKDSSGVAGLYYRNKLTSTEIYGIDGIRGPSHIGGHCAWGISTRAISTDLGGKDGKCIMYGEGGDKEPPSRSAYCTQCRTILKARNLDDIVSPWVGRTASAC